MIDFVRESPGLSRQKQGFEPPTRKIQAQDEDAGGMPRIKWRRNKKLVGLPLRVTPSSPSLPLGRISR